MLRDGQTLLYVRPLKRLAQLAVAGLVLALGLTACGGGGGGGGGPQLTIVPAPTASDLEAAAVVEAGQTVDGTLETPSDVKYYRLQVTEGGVFEFKLEGEAGLELAVLDTEGNVLTTARTASEATIRYNFGPAEAFREAERRAILRVANVVKRGGQIAFKFVASNLGPVQTVVNIIKAIPEKKFPVLELHVLGYGVTLDLTEYFSFPEDATAPAAYITLHAGKVKAMVEYRTVRFYTDESGLLLADGETISGTMAVCVAGGCTDTVVNFIVRQAITVKRPYRTSPVRTQGVVNVRTAGSAVNESSRVWRSRPLTEYFDYPSDAQPTFTLEGTPPTGWRRSIQDNRLMVSFLSGVYNPGTELGRVRLSATIPDRPNKAVLTFRITILAAEAEEMEEQQTQTITVKPAYRGGGVVVRTRGSPVSAGRAWGTPQSLREYFSYPSGTQPSFALEGSPPAGWQTRIVDDSGGGKRLIVNWGFNSNPPGSNLEVRLSATIPDQPAAILIFRITILEDESPSSSMPDQGTPSEGTPAVGTTAYRECQVIIEFWRGFDDSPFISEGAVGNPRTAAQCRESFCTGIGRNSTLPSGPLVCRCCGLM